MFAPRRVPLPQELVAFVQLLVRPKMLHSPQKLWLGARGWAGSAIVVASIAAGRTQCVSTELLCEQVAR